MEEIQTGVDNLTVVPPTTDDLGVNDSTEGTPPSDLDDDGSGTSPEKEGLKDALLAERRKRQEYENELYKVRSEIQDLKTKVDKPVATDVDTQLRGMTTDQLQDLYDSSVDYESPNYEQLKPFRKNISKALDDKRIEKTVETLTLQDEDKRIKKEKVEADVRALGAYPDIAKPESKLFKVTQQVMAEYAFELRRAGTNIDKVPRFLEICANEAAKRLGIEAKTAFERGRNIEYDRQIAAGLAGLDTGVRKTQQKEPEISENLKKMATEIGNDPKKVAVRLARMKGGK